MTSFHRRSSETLRAGTARGRLAVAATLLGLTVLVVGISPRGANAGIVIQAVNSSEVAGGTGSFDVVLNNTGGTSMVSGFSVELSVAPNSGITFTGASVSTTTAPYLFTTFQSSPPFAFPTFPNFEFTTADASMTAPGYVSLTQTYGLEHVTYAVAPGTLAGAIPVTIVTGNSTQILDLNADILASTTTNGTITVVGAAVPAPSSLLMGIIAAASLIVVRQLLTTAWIAPRLSEKGTTKQAVLVLSTPIRLQQYYRK